MERASNVNLPKIAYVFGDLTGGGHNLQAFKTIIYSGAANNCIAISLSHNEDNRLESMLVHYGIKVFYCDSGKGGILGVLLSLRAIILRNRCKIAHSNGLRADLACHYSLKGMSVKHIITLHNYLRDDAFLRMNKIKASFAVMIQAHLLKRCKYIVTCSKTLESQMTADNPALKLFTIQNGVDTEVFCPMNKSDLREAYGIPKDKIIFISTGRMSTRKRIGETAIAFRDACLDDQYELWFVGTGEKFEEYRQKYAYKNVKFWGRRDDIPNLLNIADVFVSSSESEGLPLAVLESIGCGTPVILSNIPQHKEILDKLPEAGVLYSLGVEHELSEIFSSYEQVKSLGLNSLKGTCFDINVMGKKYAAYYLDVIDSQESTKE